MSVMDPAKSESAARRAAVPPVQLREIDINVTNLCNLRCVYCSYSSTPGRHEPSLPGERVHDVLQQAAALGTRVVHFSGGEPVIRPDMPELIAHASSLGFKMRMHSNGALLTVAKLTELWRAGLRQVLVSLDGFAENHDYHRAKPGLYARTLAGIENAVSLGYNVRVNAVATTRNVDDIPRLLPMLADLRVATFSVFYCIPVGRGREVPELMVPPARWRRFLAEMRDQAERRRPENMEVTAEKVFSWSDEWEQPAQIESGRGGGCLGFLESCNYVNLLADGRVFPCVCFIDDGPALGNVHERPLADMLHDPASWAFYHGLQPVNATCGHCSLVGACRGGSRALSRYASGDWSALDPRCSGDPHAQQFMPVCFMLRENIATRSQSGFAERVG